MNYFSGRKTYIVGALIVLFGLLEGASIIPNEVANQIIVILLGLMGITLRQGVAKAEK